MEHLIDEIERVGRREEISLTPPTPWLGFDHDATANRIVPIEEYPLRRNWTGEEIRRLEAGEVPASRTLDEILALLQSWLFFGLLESAFSVPFRICDYVRIIDGRHVVDTTELRTCIDNYHAYLISDQGTEPVLREQREGIVKSLLYASEWNARLAKFSAFGYPLAANPETLTHIARLTVLVAEAVWTVGQQFPSDEPRFFIDCTWRLESGYERQLKQRVTDRGWCLSLFERMNNFARLPASLFEYMSIVPCPKFPPNGHRICQGTLCSEYNVPDPVTYQATHRSQDCTCRKVRFPVRAIEDALSANAIAIVDTDKLLKPNSHNFVEICSPSSPLRFVTFSHVWSDGLGSDTERGLPECQVAYLRNLAMDAAGTPNIWIDSLCIPRRPDLRAVAISRMSEAYKSSYATIVLDDGIRRCTTQDSSQAQLLAVALSTWQERLWTLSESVLSTRVLVAFEESLKSSKDILDIGLREIHRPVVRMGCTLLDNMSHGMFAGDVTIGAIQRNLCHRTSSWADDESLAVGPLMNIDLSPLLQLDGDERMMRFWTLVERVPKSIIIETSPKFHVDGFRWAPKSLMNSKCDVMMDFRDQSAVVTEEGLWGEFFYYRLHMPGNAMPWSRTLTFFESNSGNCLSLDAVEGTIQDPLLPGDVICFPDKAIISQPTMGALLRPIENGTDGKPRYRFRTLAAVALRPVDTMHDTEGFLGSLLTGAIRLTGRLFLRADEEHRQILIC